MTAGESGDKRRSTPREATAVTTTLFGIRNCDTMKKAWTWLDQHGVAYEFHDYKKQGIERERLQAWVAKLGWEVLLNRSGTTFRKLPDADRTGIDAAKAIELMLAQPSMIKRPVLDVDGDLLVAFKPADYERRFG
jgi:arsenate reductase